MLYKSLQIYKHSFLPLPLHMSGSYVLDPGLTLSAEAVMHGHIMVVTPLHLTIHILQPAARQVWLQTDVTSTISAQTEQRASNLFTIVHRFFLIIHSMNTQE